jgi:hypothetical protein
MSITFSTCWYNFKAKFNPSIYYQWIDNMLSNVNNYNLVIYCDYDGFKILEKYDDNNRIKIVIKPHNQFYTYRYRAEWISNHEKNDLLKDRVDWKLNMLWSEKIHFVNQTMINKYFDTDFYGWCDIGYFRGRPNDTTIAELVNWPNPEKIAGLDPKKIYYACVNNNTEYMNMLTYIVNDKNDLGLPKMHIPAHQVSIAGGFFICHKSLVEWWRDTLDEKLALYFKHGYLVKDDQIIVADCVLSDLEKFVLCNEEDPRYDNWFMFQRLLL